MPGPSLFFFEVHVSTQGRLGDDTSCELLPHAHRVTDIWRAARSSCRWAAQARPQGAAHTWIPWQ